jgi:hypothetical protein
METNIEKRVNKNRLNIGHIPSWAKKLFTERAVEEFSDNYGQCLAAMIKECTEYNQLKKMFFDNELNVQLLFNNPAKPDEDDIKLGNGKKIRRR